MTAIILISMISLSNSGKYLDIEKGSVSFELKNPLKMKTLILILLTATITLGQEEKATILLPNGQYIVNAPSDRDWKLTPDMRTDDTIKMMGFSTYTGYDTLVADNEAFNRISYYGTGWRHSNDNTFGTPLPGANGCSCSYSNVINDSIVFRFTDTNHFEWRGELQSHHGIVDVYWNNVYQGEIDTYDTRNLAFTRNFVKDGLDTLQVYKFKLVVTGRKNIASTGTYIVNHGFKIWKDGFKPVEPPVDPEPCIPEIVYVTDTVIVTDTIWMVPVFEYKPNGGSFLK